MKGKILIFIILLSVYGCSDIQETQEQIPKFDVYVIGSPQENQDTITFVIEEDENIDLFDSFLQDRQKIESEDRYKLIREQADKEKKERERLECYKRHDKNESIYYLEECE